MDDRPESTSDRDEALDLLKLDLPLTSSQVAALVGVKPASVRAKFCRAGVKATRAGGPGARWRASDVRRVWLEETTEGAA